MRGADVAFAADRWRRGAARIRRCKGMTMPGKRGAWAQATRTHNMSGRCRNACSNNGWGEETRGRDIWRGRGGRDRECRFLYDFVKVNTYVARPGRASYAERQI
eukprot:3197257-Rhodomonas_salina.1